MRPPDEISSESGGFILWRCEFVMKKFVFALLCVCLCVQPCFAFYDMNSDNKKVPAKIESFNKKMELLVKDTSELADKIAAFNKPVFEAKLTRKEREYYADIGDSEISMIQGAVLSLVNQ